MLVVQFEFHGGCADGRIVVGNDDLERRINNPARALWYHTDKGRIGARVLEVPPKVELHEIVQEMKDRVAPVVPPEWEEETERTIRLVAEAKAIGLKCGEMRHVYQVTKRDDPPDGLYIHLDFVGVDLDSPRDCRL